MLEDQNLVEYKPRSSSFSRPTQSSLASTHVSAHEPRLKTSSLHAGGLTQGELERKRQTDARRDGHTALAEERAAYEKNRLRDGATGRVLATVVDSCAGLTHLSEHTVSSARRVESGGTGFSTAGAAL